MSEKTLLLNTLCLNLQMEKVYTFRWVVSARRTPFIGYFFLRRTFYEKQRETDRRTDIRTEVWRLCILMLVVTDGYELQEVCNLNLL